MSEESATDTQTMILNFRVTAAERERLRSLRERLQQRETAHVRVTDKRTFLEALDALEMRLNELDRKRKR